MSKVLRFLGVLGRALIAYLFLVGVGVLVGMIVNLVLAALLVVSSGFTLLMPVLAGVVLFYAFLQEFAERGEE